MGTHKRQSLIFDQFIEGTGVRYSDGVFDDWLGSRDLLKLFVVVDNAVDVDGVNLTMQETPDRAGNWDSSAEGNNEGGTANLYLNGAASGVVTGYNNRDTRGGPPMALRRAAVTLWGGAAPSARVRVWAIGRGPRRTFHCKVLSEHMMNGAVLHTASADAKALGVSEDLLVSVTGTQVSGTDPMVELQLEESPNGSLWTPYGPLFQCNVWNAMDPNSTSVGWVGPPSGFIRASVAMTGTNASAKVNVWFTGMESPYSCGCQKGSSRVATDVRRNYAGMRRV